MNKEKLDKKLKKKIEKKIEKLNKSWERSENFISTMQEILEKIFIDTSGPVFWFFPLFLGLGAFCTHSTFVAFSAGSISIGFGIFAGIVSLLLVGLGAVGLFGFVSGILALLAQIKTKQINIKLEKLYEKLAEIEQLELYETIEITKNMEVEDLKQQVKLVKQLIKQNKREQRKTNDEISSEEQLTEEEQLEYLD